MDDEQLENASGGYGIIHRHDGFKQLVNDKGKLIGTAFWNTDEAKRYAEEHKHGFERGKEWELFS